MIYLKKAEFAEFSPDSRLLALVGNKVTVMDCQSRRVVFEGKVGQHPCGSAFSPSGDQLVVKSTAGSLTAVDLASGEQKRIGQPIAEGVRPVFSSDGRYLIDATWDSRVRVFETSTWAVKSEQSFEGHFLESMSRSPDDVFLASQSPLPVGWTSQPGHVLVWRDLLKPPTVTRPTPSFPMLGALAGAPGNTAFVIGFDCVHRINIETGESLADLIGTWSDYSICADGTKVVAIHSYMINKDGHQHSLKSGLVGAASKTTELALVDCETMKTEASAYFPNLSHVRISPDGRWIFVGAEYSMLFTAAEFLDYASGIGPALRTSRGR